MTDVTHKYSIRTKHGRGVDLHAKLLFEWKLKIKKWNLKVFYNKLKKRKKKLDLPNKVLCTYGTW